MLDMLHIILENIVDGAILLFEFIGVGIIIFSGIRGFFLYIRRSPDTKLTLAKGLAMGLEFKLGSEILRTVVVRDWKEIGIVAGRNRSRNHRPAGGADVSDSLGDQRGGEAVGFSSLLCYTALFLRSFRYTNPQTTLPSATPARISSAQCKKNVSGRMLITGSVAGSKIQ